MKRDLGAADEIFDVPAINYFTSNNDYLGSWKSNFRYKISNTDGKIKSEIWNEDVCFELAEITCEKEFELTPEGLTECIKWLYSQIKQ